jgi:hypothetical protein
MRRQHETLRGKKHNDGIAVVVRHRVMVCVRIACRMVWRARIVRAATKFDITCKSIGEVKVMLCVFDAIHDPDEGLS